jgi:hypothetical protein
LTCRAFSLSAAGFFNCALPFFTNPPLCSRWTT